VSEVWTGAVYAGIAALGNVAGGALVLMRRTWSVRGLKTALAFGGGFMLSAAVVSMAPESFRLMPLWGPALVLVGYLTVHFLEHVVGGHYHFAGDQHGPDHLLSATVTGATLFAMLVHTFFDGVAIGSAFSVNEKIGLVVFISVILHKIPGGFAVSTVALASGSTRNQAFGFALLMGLGTVLGSVALTAAEPFATYALPFSTGTLLHVGASDLIPEVNEGERWPITIWVIAGGLVFLGLRHFMGPMT